MVFSSALFLFYFLPLFLAGYFLMPQRFKNGYLALVSLVFYAWGAPNFLLIFLGSCLADYLLVKRMGGAERKVQKWLLIISTVLNVGLLIYFKYTNFLVEQVQGLCGLLGLHSPHWPKVVLPIGISFFTFHKVSYVVDVFRGKSSPTRGLGEYLLYITFFPQLIAGPIVRYHEIDTQIRSRSVTFAAFSEGVWRFVLGLSAKVLLADPLGNVADHVFNRDPANLSTAFTWIGTLAYTMQIYFDFAGYSSMAIGLALMVGFTFPENFNRPYLAGSVTEFWRRWHMSLSRWMRDYLYIPLGGNRVGPVRQMFNLWTVFLLSGLWHGANWSFIVWGAYHGMFLAVERTGIGQRYLAISGITRRLITFVLVMFGWVLFRSNTLGEGLARWGRLLGFGGEVPSDALVYRASIISDYGLIVLSVAFGWILIVEPLLEQGEQRRTDTPLYHRFPLLYPALAVLMGLCILAIEAGSYSPFIYFQF